MKSLRKKILASALAITLVGGIFAPKASAADATKEQIWEKLNITKIVNKVEKGVTTPDVEFEFAFKPKKEDDPAIPNAKIKFGAQDDEDKDDTTSGKQIIKTIPIDLSNIEWKRTGEHIYTLTEVIPKDNKVEDMKYSEQDAKKQIFRSYQIRFYVEDKEGKLQASKITVAAITHGGKGEKKLDYDDTIGVKFLNNYDKKDGNTPDGGTDITDDDKKGFAFKKIVDSKKEEDLGKTFDFDVNVEKPAESHSKDTEFKYVVVDKDGGVSGEQTAAYGKGFTVSLKDKERVVFTDVILGSKVSVTEKDAKGLTPSVKGSLLELKTEGKSITGIIGDNNGGNYAEFTNKNVPLTGVLIDNLPYIALVAVAGLGIFFFVKNRREEEIYA